MFLLFQAYVRDTNRQFAANTVSAIGRCAVRLPAVAAACVEGLLMLAKGALLTSDGKEVDEEEQETLSTQGKPKVPSKQKGSQEAGVVAQAVLALRSIVQQNPSEQEQVQNVLLSCAIVKATLIMVNTVGHTVELISKLSIGDNTVGAHYLPIYGI